MALMVNFLASAVFCQSVTSQGSTGAVPDNILYRAFFHQVTIWKGFADKEVAHGIFNGPAARHYQVVAGLTAGEKAVVRSISVDCEATLANITGQRSQLTAPYRAASMASQIRMPPSVAQQVSYLDAQRAAALSGHLQQLKSAFATSRFEVLDAFIRKTMQFSRSPATSIK